LIGILHLRLLPVQLDQDREVLVEVVVGTVAEILVDMEGGQAVQVPLVGSCHCLHLRLLTMELLALMEVMAVTEEMVVCTSTTLVLVAQVEVVVVVVVQAVLVG
jgi:hypothetical protein